MALGPYYVDFAAVGTGGDGSSGSPWTWDSFVAAAQDLTGHGEVIVYCQGRRSISASDSMDSDWSVGASATDYLHFIAWPGFEGTDTNVQNYPGWQTTADWIHVTVNQVGTRLTGLGFTNTRGSLANNSRNIQFTTGSSGVNVIRECIMDGGWAQQRCCQIDGGGDLDFYNCLFIGGRVHIGDWNTPTFWHCTLADSLWQGFYQTGGNSNSTFYNCLVYGVATANEDYPVTGSKTMNGCAGEDDFTGTDANYTTLTADPFVDRVGGDYTLADGSQPIDQGAQPGSGLTIDLIQNPRLAGSAPDCGCIEWQAAPVGGKPLLQRSNIGNDLYDGTIL